MQEIVLFSPAKINLFFRVLRKREDGYHDIASLIQTVSMGDTLSFKLSSRDRFESSDPELSWDPHNLIYRAVHLFRQKLNLPFCVEIILDKRIPKQAGLGGGSSNAATTLYALNSLLGALLSEATLADWGKVLGADVPLFFSQGRVFCEGIGERLTPVACLQESYSILKPRQFNLATAQVYANCTPQGVSQEDPRVLLEGFAKGCGEGVNDLERAAFKLLPALQECKQRYIDLGFKNVVMTGSGTAFIAKGEEAPFSLPDTEVFQVRAISKKASGWFS
ncbi:MAG: 4-(cytidine 5'-diphospho)-2-C-methyl-D-erythritol kinase [Chlamydiae bacterium]|nr:4-(cytidine 5'-diphospho)-2-C-methyl-D-erythritol kinase [Chlamydiota bacterium]